MQILKQSGHTDTCLTLQEGVKGYYTIRVKDAATGDVKKEIGPFANDLTLLGLNQIGTSSAISYGYVGTGTNAPSNSDTSMGTFKVRSNTRGVSRIAPTAPRWYNTRVTTFTFNAGTIDGNITEVGVGWTVNSANGLWSRQLILDSNGMPVTLTVLPNEILELVYALRYYPAGVDDFFGSFSLNAITYNYQARLSTAANTSNGDGACDGPYISTCYAAGATLGPVTSSIAGTSVSGPSSAKLPYVANSYKAAATSSFSLTQGNHATGLQAFRIKAGAPSAFFDVDTQMVLDKPIPKTNLNTMSITLEIAWGPYTGPL